ncbi:hypothetical protein DFJ67_7933 [Asanoa ferruginea]|uniref:Uncharacterized protein n=1 Tax=Asanoa ferruginea TaxID=53367 RepID=A0A3E0A0B6_9ACTN|nr:hypothetical protein [Asanoa ferruginea]REG01844.1 hypothetical protein DFJ67_7933 [Asanoa ferruginea]GIF50279.1 hypothetical protein Afe04nite_48180 [Asanoa ferruginea]
MGLFCRLGWHGWTGADGQVACGRCRSVAVAARPVQVRIVWWSLVGIIVVSLARAAAALAVRADVEAFAAVWWPRHIYRAQIADTRSVVSYSVFVGVILAVVLVPLVVALRGPLARAHWITFGVLCASLLTQVVYISNDVAQVVPGWYPLTQQLLELVLLVASGAVLVLLLHSASGLYFDEGVGRRDASDDDFDRAVAAIRKSREL